jgi:predicted RecA/RadA family phage recombinase
MQNYNGRGEVLHLTAPTGSPGGVTSGVPVLIGSLLVIPTQTAAGGAAFEGVAEGVFLGSKPQTEVWVEGAPVYFDDVADVFTESAGASPANVLVGVSVDAARAAVEIASDAAGSPGEGVIIAANVITLVDYLNVEDATITLTIPRDGGVPDRVEVFVEGVDFDAATDNATTATAIAAALSARLGITAVAGLDGSTPANSIVTVTIDEPVKGRVRLDGVVR